MGWAIPNISAMLRRLGQAKSKYYAKMDLTSGYFQAPLSENSRRYTAFVTWCGLYEWTRVPMGLKGAPSYFQQMMTQFVLIQLVHITCELYLDDILVHATTEDELINRLRTVFERLRKHKITLNPEKCEFGLNEVNFVGHTLSANGISMSADKKQSIINFPKPKTAKELRSFLGLANYFRDHVRNHSIVVYPLQQMIQNYDKKRVLIWTTETENAFKAIVKAINECPTLYFMDYKAQIILQTDASDYGIGAYLFQIIDGKECPVQFLSKTLAKDQRRWSTPEKEGFAIYYALMQFKHLLRDCKFTLRTDHRNLIFINEGGSPKVMRWKMEIQPFDYDSEHIEGAKNIPPDVFSRIMPDNNEEVTLPDQTVEYLNILDEIKIPSDKYKIISKYHNIIFGHHGVDRTVQYVQKNEESWLNMRAHVSLFIKKCPCCQKMSAIKCQFILIHLQHQHRYQWND